MSSKVVVASSRSLVRGEQQQNFQKHEQPDNIEEEHTFGRGVVTTSLLLLALVSPRKVTNATAATRIRTRKAWNKLRKV